MSGYSTTSEAVYKTLCADELLLDLLEFIEPEGEEDPDYRIFSGWPEGEEIPLTADQPAYLIITNESDSSIGVYGQDELFQIRVVALGHDLCEDLKDRLFKIIQREFSFINESRFTAASERIQLGGGRPMAGPILNTKSQGSEFWSVNVRFSLETVTKG